MKDKRDILVAPVTYATVLAAALFEEYGAEWIEWDPTATTVQIESDFSISLPQKTADRIHAAASLLGTNLFHKSLEVFGTTCNAFSFVPVFGSSFIPPDLTSCVWGCAEAQLLLGRQEFEEEGFDPRIKQYVGIVMVREGLYRKPSMLRFAELPEKPYNDPAGFENLDVQAAFEDRQHSLSREMDSLAALHLTQLVEQLRLLPSKLIDPERVEAMRQMLS